MSIFWAKTAAGALFFAFCNYAHHAFFQAKTAQIMDVLIPELCKGKLDHYHNGVWAIWTKSSCLDDYSLIYKLNRLYKDISDPHWSINPKSKFLNFPENDNDFGFSANRWEWRNNQGSALCVAIHTEKWPVVKRYQHFHNLQTLDPQLV